MFASYFVAVLLQKTRESCDEIPSGSLRWISLGTFLSKLWVNCCKIICMILLLSRLTSHEIYFCLLYKLHWVNRYNEYTSNSTEAVSPLDQALSMSVRLSCGRAGGNLKVLWKTKSGPAAAASCWPTLFRGSRYRLMTGLLLSGPHY